MVSKSKNLKTRVKVSVLMSVYNAEKYLADAIDSILNQSFSQFELIIIDDCSFDMSWDIIREYAKKDKRIIAKRNEKNIGGCLTLNLGLALVTGDYVARADNDDISYPNRLQKQYAFLKSHPEVGIVGGTMEIMDESGRVYAKRTYGGNDLAIRKKIFRYSPFAHPLVMYRMSVIQQVGMYDPEYAPADDYDLWFRIGSVSKFANLPDILLKYRIVKNSLTHMQTNKMENATLKVRKRYKNGGIYKMTSVDTLYYFIEYAALIFPTSFKMNIFNMLRNTK